MLPLMHIAYLLTGGNLGNREANLARARAEVEAHCGKILALSAIYETAAWGKEDQPTFLNQAIKIETNLPPQQLLEKLLEIEKNIGRVRGLKYGPRLIDIDIIFYDEAVISEPGLTVPHPQLPRRRFALQCINDLAPHFIHPVLQQSVSDLLQECDDPLMVMKWE